MIYLKLRSLSITLLLVSIWLSAFLSLFYRPVLATGNIIYVDTNSSSLTPNGTTWNNAYPNLQDALANAVSGDEIWVASGIYYPDEGNTQVNDDAEATFSLLDGVSIYGGFAGTEVNRQQRDYTTHVTILSGDIGQDDMTTNGVVLTTTNQVGDNSYHVVSSINLTNTAVLDGFTITGGQADIGRHRTGGGMLNDNSSPTVNHINFSGNFASSSGGGMHNRENSSPHVNQTSFSNNLAESNGGGMYNYNNSNPVLNHVEFSQNSAGYFGGGLYNTRSSPTISQAIFTENSTVFGGGIANYDSHPILIGVSFNQNIGGSGGGMYNSLSNPTVQHSSFTQNTATSGAGIYNRDDSTPNISETIFAKNNADNIGGGIANYQSDPTIYKVTFFDNWSRFNGGGIYNGESNPKINSTIFSGNQSSLGGGVFNTSSSPILSNIVISGNLASSGGGIYNTSHSTPTLINASITQNTTSSFGAGIYNADSNPIIINTIIWDNSVTNIGSGQTESVHNRDSTPSLNHSLIQHSNGSGASWNSNIGLDHGGNIDEDPLFTPSSTQGGTVNHLYLHESSPAIDTGNTISYTFLSLNSLDLAGIPRIIGSDIDLGAYEFSVNCPSTGNIIYVDQFAPGSNNGDSWTNAFTDLKSGIDLFSICKDVSTEVWVARGIYTPGKNIDNTFVLTDSLAIYGGFAATETLRTQRNHIANLTILSGDIDGDDITQNGIVTTTTHQVGDNSIHVVYANGVTNTAVVDGFTITAGQANKGSAIAPYDSYGGGLVNIDSSPILKNIIFSGNKASRDGGGIANFGSSPTLNHITFSQNRADRGGGLANYDLSHPNLSHVIFIHNIAEDGGGMLNHHSDPFLNNVTFSNNMALRSCGGGLYNDFSKPTLVNVTFSNNIADYCGGGIHNYNSQPSILNTTFYANNAINSNGGAISHYGNPMTITNSIFWDNLAQGVTNTTNAIISGSSNATVFSNSLIQNSGGSGLNWTNALGTDGGNNIDADPLFISPVSQSSISTTTAGLQLQFGSPAINAGNTLSYTTITTESTDLAGNLRIFDSVIDMGAYEFNQYPLTIVQTGLFGPEYGSGIVTDSSGRIHCEKTCELGMNPNETVTLTATADQGSSFVGWTGAISNTNSTITLTIDQAATVTATYDLQAGTGLDFLQVAKSGDGTGHIVSSDLKIDCGDNCSFPFVTNSVVTLTATADPGSLFNGWTGAVNSNSQTITITMNSSQNITGTFTADPAYSNKVYLPWVIRR